LRQIFAVKKVKAVTTAKVCRGCRLTSNESIFTSQEENMSVVDSRVTLVALQGLRQANADLNKSAERLATGLRINQAADDPAGYGKASKLKAEIGSYYQVKRNISEGLSALGKVTDGLSTIADYLVEMRSISLAASAETDTDVISNYQDLLDEYVNSINDIAENTKWGDDSVLDGTSTSESVQTGIDSGDQKDLTFASVSAGALSVSAITLSSGGANGIAAIDSAIDTVAGKLAQVGGYQKSLEGSLDLADSNILSKSSQYGSVMNADLALEATNLAAARIRQDSATAVLAQANSMNRTIADYLLNGAIG
jgi:flagellin